MTEVDCDPTHYTETISGMRPASTCSTSSRQKGQVLPRRSAYRKKNCEDYEIINGCRTANDSLDVPHDFLPCQAYLIFHRRECKRSTKKHRSRGLLRLRGSKGNHRRRRWWPQSNNTGQQPLVLSRKSGGKPGAYPCRGTGDSEARRSGKSGHRRGQREWPHSLLPWSIISSNLANDIRDEREEGGPC